MCKRNTFFFTVCFLSSKQPNSKQSVYIIKCMCCTHIVQTINITLLIAEGRKREVDHSLGLFKTIYCDFISWCFQFSIRMVANLTHSELDYFEKLAILISILSMCSICEGIRCEG